jgi:hypothetical protein
VIGVDDFAFLKGRRYGTIVVDPERHRPIELLADRSAETLAAWLKEHPGVRTISRDRSTEYERAVKAGAPQATEVADRWHLLKNLREVTQRMLERNWKKLAGAAGSTDGSLEGHLRSREVSLRGWQAKSGQGEAAGALRAGKRASRTGPGHPDHLEVARHEPWSSAQVHTLGELPGASEASP